MTVSRQIGQGASKEAQSDTFYIVWTLLRTCNYACSYCFEPRNVDCVMLKERLLTMARHALEPAHEFYDITFTGGEPSLHPCLPDIVRYINISGRRTRISIETNGSRELAWFKEMVDGKAPGFIRFVISVHPAHADIRHILPLTAWLVQEGHKPVIRLAHDPGAQQATENFLNAFARLHAAMPFDFEIQELRDPKNPGRPWNAYVAAQSDWREKANATFHSGEEHEPVPNELVYLDESSGRDDFQKMTPGSPSGFCCAGANLLRIEPDGSCYLTGCHRLASTQPLWQKGIQLPKPDARFCDNVQCGIAVGWSPIVFPSADDAKFFLETARQKATAMEWDSPRPLNPETLEPDAFDDVRVRLKNMRHGINQPKDMGVDYGGNEWLEPRFADVCAACEAFADAASVETFLRAIRAIRSGDGAYLEESGFVPYGHPQVPIEPGYTIFALGTHAKKAAKLLKKAVCGIQLLTLDRMPGDIFSLEDILRAQKQFVSMLTAPVGSVAEMDNLAPVILDFEPALVFGLTGPAILDVPLWLRQNFPGYQLHFGCHSGHGYLLYARPQTKPLKKAPVLGEIPGHLVTVCLYCSDGAESLKATLDAFLLQSMHDFDVLVSDDSQQAQTGELLATYGRMFPKKIRYLRHSSSTGRAGAMHVAMNRATGRYLVFANAGDIPARDFLARVTNLCQQQSSEAVVDISGLDPADSLSGTACPGREFTDMLLAQKEVPAMPWVCLLAKDALKRSRPPFEDAAACAGLPQYLKTLYLAQNVALIANAGYQAAHIKPVESGQGGFSAFMTSVDSICAFFRRHGLDTASTVFNNLMRALWHEYLPGICSQIREARQSGSLADVLTVPGLKNFGNVRELLAQALDTLAAIHGATHKVDLSVSDGDWRETRLDATVDCLPYGNADTPVGRAPILSVVIPNHNKNVFLKETLKSVLGQSLQDFELIIIDDASTDGSFETLAGYAERFANIRLYRMAENVRQGICRNIGIDKSRGRYLIFVDSDDICLPGFFAHAVALMEKGGVEMALFSCQHLDEMGDVVWSNSFENGRIGRRQALRDFYANRFEPACWAKIFSRKFIIDNNIRFTEFVYHQDVPFFHAALCRMNAAATSPQQVYMHVRAVNSVMNPEEISYLHLHSAYVFQHFQQTCICDQFGDDFTSLPDTAPDQQLRWNLDNCLLPKCVAFKNAIGEIPMSAEDYRLLSGATHFIGNVLLEIAEGWTPDLVGETASGAQNQTSDTLLSVILVSRQIQDMQVLADILPEPCAYAELLVQAKDGQDMRHLEYMAFNDSRIQVLPAQEENILQKTSGEYVILLPAGYRLNPEAALSGLEMLEYDDKADFVLFCGSGETGNAPRLLQKSEMLQEFAAGKLGVNLTANTIFRKSFLAGAMPTGANPQAFTFPLLVHANAARAVILPGELSQKDAAAGFVAQLQNLDAALADLGFTHATLEQHSVGNDHKSNIWSHYLGQHLAPALRACCASTDDLEKIMTPQRLRFLFENQDATQKLLHAHAQRLKDGASTETVQDTRPGIELIPLCPSRADKIHGFCLLAPVEDNADNLLETIKTIPPELADEVEILIIDNCSEKASTAEILGQIQDTFANTAHYQAPWHLETEELKSCASSMTGGNRAHLWQAGTVCDETWWRNILAGTAQTGKAHGSMPREDDLEAMVRKMLNDLLVMQQK